MFYPSTHSLLRQEAVLHGAQDLALHFRSFLTGSSQPMPIRSGYINSFNRVLGGLLLFQNRRHFEECASGGESNYHRSPPTYPFFKLFSSDQIWRPSIRAAMRRLAPMRTRSQVSSEDAFPSIDEQLLLVLPNTPQETCVDARACAVQSHIRSGSIYRSPRPLWLVWLSYCLLCVSCL